MGWNAELYVGKKIAQVPNYSGGSTVSICMDGSEGTQEASISITYNYSELYYLVINQNLSDYLHGKTGRKTIPTLKILVEKLGTSQYRRLKDGVTVNESLNPENYFVDYWIPTMGNAGYIASVLLDWAQLHPEGIWSISK